MLDKWAIQIINPTLVKVADIFKKVGIPPDQISIVGFFLGLMAVPALWYQNYWIALTVIVINRIMDGLDGALARLGKPTDAGGFLDITLDFIFYSATVLGFGLANPGQNGIAAATLIFSFMGTGSSFLAFAVMAAKQNIKSIHYPQKSLYYLGGLTEGTETIAVFVLCCIFPEYFPELAYGFAILCGTTTILRIFAGYRTLKNKDLN
ncbi:MAG: CDP-alcohol phosphatidyltransferase family protein [Deltaproteobacteria bacterium]|nr:CDP-alcohol phosphatidyltransferase family protein [Deltaproteobacteria bacterium]